MIWCATIFILLMDLSCEPNSEEPIPDLVLLLVFQYITHQKDVFTLCNVSQRWRQLALSEQMIQHIHCTDLHWTSTKLLQDFVFNIGPDILTLNLNHCCWLDPMQFAHHCINVESLQMLEIPLTAREICHLLSGMPNLKCLSVSMIDAYNFMRELQMSSDAKICLQGLTHIWFHFPYRSWRSLQYGISHLKNVCTNLQELRIYSSSGRSGVTLEYSLQLKTEEVHGVLGRNFDPGPRNSDTWPLIPEVISDLRK